MKWAHAAILSLFTIGIGSCSAQTEYISTDFDHFESNFDALTEYQRSVYWGEVQGKYVQWRGVVLSVSDDGTILLDLNHLQYGVAEVVLATGEPSEVLSGLNRGDLITFTGRLNRFEYREIGRSYLFYLTVGRVVSD